MAWEQFHNVLSNVAGCPIRDTLVSGDEMNSIGVSNLRRLAAFAPEGCWGLLVGLLAMPPVAGQSTGSIVGRVTDVSGAVVADAKIVVTSVETGLKRTTTTTSEGYF